MKKLFSLMTTYFVAASLVISPLLAQAQHRGNVRPVPKKYREDFMIDKKFLNNLGYKVQWDHANKRGLVYDEKTNKLVMEMPYASDKDLRKYSPSNFEARLIKEMARASLAYEQASDRAKEIGSSIGSSTLRSTKKAGKILGGSTKAAWVHTIKRLPTESAMFFMAMGAVAAGQLFLNYSQNPVAFQQHLEHQLSPLGVIGFGSFMLSQGIASNVMMSYFGNSKLNFMIPYLGMTVGFFVQSYLSQVLADPNVAVCAKSWIGMKPTQRDYELGATENACDAAYEYLIIKKQLWVFAPGLASMLLSSAAAAGLQKGVQMGAAAAAGGDFKAVTANLKVINKTGVTTQVARLRWLDLAILFTPGQMQIKGFRAVIVHGLQITAFVALDAWFNRWVTTAWKNAFDGKDLEETNEELVTAINTMKQGEWNGDEKELIEKLKEFKDQMAGWRMINMSSVYEANGNWSTAIGKMTGTYNASKQFYEDFGDQIRNSKYGLQVMKPLQQIYPLKGVTAHGLPADGQEAQDPDAISPASAYFPVDLPVNIVSATPAESDMYFTFPKNLEAQQIATVKKAVGYLELKLIDESLRVNAAELAALKKTVAELNAGLKSYSLERGYYLGRAIYEFNRTRRTLGYNRSLTPDFLNVMWTAYQIMGKPDPMLAPGRGFVTTYAEAPINQEHLAGAEFDHVKHQVGVFAAPTIADKFVMQMLCGPDAHNGQMLTEDKWGFPSNFTPPRIHTGVADISKVCNSNFLPPSPAPLHYTNGSPAPLPYTNLSPTQLQHADAFYTQNVSVRVPDSNRAGKDNTITYRGYLEYMIANSITAAIGTPEKLTMKEWWERTTESQMRKAFDQYGQSYNEIVATMLEAMFRTDRHILNRGPIANGIADAIQEQEDIYYRMLSDLLYPTKTAFDVKFGQKHTRVRMHPTLMRVREEFDRLMDMIAQIKVVPAGQMPDFEGKVRCDGPAEYVRIESNLENSDIEEQIQNVKLALTNVAKALGVNSAPLPAQDLSDAPTAEDMEAPVVAEVKQQVTLNKQQSAYATEILEGLDALAQEYSTYARIANAVTWDKIQNAKLTKEGQDSFMDKVQKMKSRLTPGG